MMWIAVHLAFAALPFVLTAALYSRKRRFPAGEGDARARDAKARKFYAQLLLVLLLLYHYSLNIFSEILFYELSLYIRYLQMFSFDLNTHEISLF